MFGQVGLDESLQASVNLVNVLEGLRHPLFELSSCSYTATLATASSIIVVSISSHG
jgi:hypothetical protein